MFLLNSKGITLDDCYLIQEKGYEIKFIWKNNQLFLELERA